MTDTWTPAVEIHLRVRIRTDQRNAFLVFLREAIPYYESPGGIRVTLLREASDPERYIEHIAYLTEEHYERDQQRVETDPVMKAFLERWRLMLSGPPVVEIYRPC